MTVVADRRPAVFLHIGPMKTGTSYLQQLMADNRQALRAEGVLFPGRDPRIDQVRGVRDVMNLYPEPEQPAELRGAWAALREEMFDFEGRASVISQEFLSFARKPRVKAIASSLQPATVHVVLTVRDASRVLPSAWATSTRNRGTASWQEYVDALVAGPDAGGLQWRRSMRALNVPAMLKNWGRVVPPERQHVVVVPPPGAPARLLWERFAQVIDVDPERLNVPGERHGESYGYYSGDLMRRVNTHLLHLPKPDYHRIKMDLLQGVLDKREGEPKPPITPTVAEFAGQWNAVTVDAIKSSGARVYGDLGDLQMTGAGEMETAPPASEDLLPVAAAAVSGLRRGEQGDPVEGERWAGAADPVAAAVLEVADELLKRATVPRQ